MSHENLAHLVLHSSIYCFFFFYHGIKLGIKNHGISLLYYISTSVIEFIVKEKNRDTDTQVTDENKQKKYQSCVFSLDVLKKNNHSECHPFISKKTFKVLLAFKM